MKFFMLVAFFLSALQAPAQDEALADFSEYPSDHLHQLAQMDEAQLEALNTPYSRAVLAEKLIGCIHLFDDNYAYDIENAHKGIALLESEAQTNALAALFLGEMHLFGNGFEVVSRKYSHREGFQIGLPFDSNPEEAKKYFLLAARGEDAVAVRAFLYLAKIELSKGAELTKDGAASAADFLEKAARLGSDTAKKELLDICKCGVRRGYGNIVFAADYEKAREIQKLKTERDRLDENTDYPLYTLRSLPKWMGERNAQAVKFEKTGGAKNICIAANILYSEKRDNEMNRSSAMIYPEGWGEFDGTFKPKIKTSDRIYEIYCESAKLGYAPAMEMLVSRYRGKLPQKECEEYIETLRSQGSVDFLIRNRQLYDASVFKKLLETDSLRDITALYESELGEEDKETLYQNMIRKTGDVKFLYESARERYYKGDIAQPLEILKALSDPAAPYLAAQTELALICFTEGRDEEGKAILVQALTDSVFFRDNARYIFRNVISDKPNTIRCAMAEFLYEKIINNKNYLSEIYHFRGELRLGRPFDVMFFGMLAPDRYIACKDAEIGDGWKGELYIDAHCGLIKYDIPGMGGCRDVARAIPHLTALADMKIPADGWDYSYAENVKADAGAILTYCYAFGLGGEKDPAKAVDRFGKTLDSCYRSNSTFEMLNEFFELRMINISYLFPGRADRSVFDPAMLEQFAETVRQKLNEDNAWRYTAEEIRFAKKGMEKLLKLYASEQVIYGARRWKPPGTGLPEMRWPGMPAEGRRVRPFEDGRGN